MELISKGLFGDLQDQIIYRGEGNSSIVIALKNRAKVIRLLKKDGKIMKSSLDHHMTQHPMSSIKFIHLIMRPLTDPFLSGPTELVHLKSELINMLSKRVEAERPLHRLDKTLHLDDQYALVMDDLCALPHGILKRLRPDIDLCGPTISVEIKPKQGFLPIQRCLMKSTTNDQITTQVKSSCLYGSVQVLKLARGRIREISSYCPIDLFSGCPIRMRSALEGLLKNPQNNFRIFKDLVLAYDEVDQTNFTNLFQDFFNLKSDTQCQGVDYELHLIELLICCLLSESTSISSKKRKGQGSLTADKIVDGDENIHSSHVNGKSCLLHRPIPTCKRCDINRSTKKAKIGAILNNKEHQLPSACVLASVLRAQQLDSIGAQEAREMLEWLLDHSDSVDVLEELSKPQIPRGFGSTCRLPDETREQYYFRKVWEFLVSLTAKDCSIIITLRRITPGRHEELLKKHPSLKSNLLFDEKTGGHYLFNVGIADLDQKMPLKIPRICEHINQTIQQLVICGESHKTRDSSLNCAHDGRKYTIL